MGKTLERLVQEFIALKGAESYSLLAKRVGKSSMTIRRWISGGVPSPHAAFLLAKALGCDKEEAIRVANEPQGTSADSA